MIEFADASEFIKDFEQVHSKKVLRIPYTTKDGLRKTILMCKCGKFYVSMPYLSLGILESKPTDRKNAPFMLFETEEGNVISTSKKPWEIRDTAAHSPYIYSDKLFIWKDISAKNDISELFSSNVNRKINKAEKERVIVKSGTTKRLINDFYHAYVRRMNEIAIAPTSKNIVKRQVKTSKTTVFVAYRDGKIVGGATLNKITDDIFANELFATLKDYNKYYVSYALHNSMIAFAKKSNAVYYSFGRSTRNSSVHDYKRQFDGEEIALYWSYSRKRKNLRDNKFLYKLWKLVPYGLTKILGPYIVKRIY